MGGELSEKFRLLRESQELPIEERIKYNKERASQEFVKRQDSEALLLSSISGKSMTSFSRPSRISRSFSGKEPMVATPTAPPTIPHKLMDDLKESATDSTSADSIQPEETTEVADGSVGNGETTATDPPDVIDPEQEELKKSVGFQVAGEDDDLSEISNSAIEVTNQAPVIEGPRAPVLCCFCL